MNNQQQSTAGYIYILKFSSALGNENHRARYYLGWALDVDARLAEHKAGHGAKITAAAVGRGFELEIVATFPGTRADERQLKSRKSHSRIVERLQRGTLRYKVEVQQ